MYPLYQGIHLENKNKNFSNTKHRNKHTILWPIFSRPNFDFLFTLYHQKKCFHFEIIVHPIQNFSEGMSPSADYDTIRQLLDSVFNMCPLFICQWEIQTYWVSNTQQELLLPYNQHPFKTPMIHHSDRRLGGEKPCYCGTNREKKDSLESAIVILKIH